jgi:hypothetical protein
MVGSSPMFACFVRLNFFSRIIFHSTKLISNKINFWSGN